MLLYYQLSYYYYYYVFCFLLCIRSVAAVAITVGACIITIFCILSCTYIGVKYDRWRGPREPGYGCRNAGSGNGEIYSWKESRTKYLQDIPLREFG